MPSTSNNVSVRPVPKMSTARKCWLSIVWPMTFLIPNFCLSMFGMRRPDIQIAWREKVAIFIIIMISCGILIFFIIGLGQIICPKTKVLSIYEVETKNTLENPYVAIYGRYYDISDVVKSHVSGSLGVEKYQMQTILGRDISQMFFPTHHWDTICPGIPNPGASWDNLMERNPSQTMWPHYASASDGTENNYLGFLEQYARGRIGWPLSYIRDTSSSTVKRLVMFDNVYDVSTYYNANPKFFDESMNWIFTNMIGKDATIQMNVLLNQNPIKYKAVLNCMNRLFYIGTVDHRNDLKCQLSNYVLVAASGIIVLIILVKFCTAMLQLFHSSKPEEQDKFVMIQVPCYTEGKDSLLNTFNSIAKLDYESRFKLMVVICDGIVTGDGNAKSTPDLALEILYGSKDRIPAQPEAHSYLAIGEGSRQHNRARVYSGIYDVKGGHHLPFILIVKTGTEMEHSKPGNRGKRDSQVMLMRFLRNIYSEEPMCPLEIELYHRINIFFDQQTNFNGFKTPWLNYEFMLMVDADTAVATDSLNHLVAAMVTGQDIIGICGETNVANEKDSWVTRIQVYEYFISHHLAKSFESFFGTVTCLPGCFCMYRIRNKNMDPFLIAPRLVDDYAENNVDTLHKKNPLTLGEDRYLTTLILKYFPKKRTTFIPSAKATSIAPDQWNVLLSQRRRWINSTIHNLVEIIMYLQGMCGCFCFSMRFIVLMDLISSIVAPAAVVYVGWLIYSLVTQPDMFPVVSIAILAGIYGLQVIIFILKQEFSMIIWMIIYCTFGMPIFNFFIPLYAFWKMNDVSWGQTRMIEGDDGKILEAAEDNRFDPASIPRRTPSEWSDFKQPSAMPQMASVHGIPVPIHMHPALQKGGMSSGTAPSWIPSNYVPSIQPPSSDDITLSSSSSIPVPGHIVPPVPSVHHVPQHNLAMMSYGYPASAYMFNPSPYGIPRAPMSDFGNPHAYPMSQSASVRGMSPLGRPLSDFGSQERRGRSVAPRSKSRQTGRKYRHRRHREQVTEDSGTESDYDVPSGSRRRNKTPTPIPVEQVAVPSVVVAPVVLPEVKIDTSMEEDITEFEKTFGFY